MNNESVAADNTFQRMNNHFRRENSRLSSIERFTPHKAQGRLQQLYDNLSARFVLDTTTNQYGEFSFFSSLKFGYGVRLGSLGDAIVQAVVQSLKSAAERRGHEIGLTLTRIRDISGLNKDPIQLELHGGFAINSSVLAKPFEALSFEFESVSELLPIENSLVPRKSKPFPSENRKTFNTEKNLSSGFSETRCG